jgi:hypothetical protein
MSFPIHNRVPSDLCANVRVYRNLRHACWSVQARVDGRWKVVAHPSWLVLSGVSLVVSQAGRARVRREARKNVHAFLIGQLVQHGFAGKAPVVVDEEQERGSAIQVVYNPFVTAQFEAVLPDIGHVPVFKAGRVTLGRCVWITEADAVKAAREDCGNVTPDETGT